MTEVIVSATDRARAARLVLGQLQGDEAMVLDAFEEARADGDAVVPAGRLLEVVLSLTADLAHVHVQAAGSREASIVRLRAYVADIVAGDTPSE